MSMLLKSYQIENSDLSITWTCSNCQLYMSYESYNSNIVNVADFSIDELNEAVTLVGATTLDLYVPQSSSALFGTKLILHVGAMNVVVNSNGADTTFNDTDIVLIPRAVSYSNFSVLFADSFYINTSTVNGFARVEATNIINSFDSLSISISKEPLYNT